MNIKLDYDIGEEIKTQTHIYKVIGFEYIPGRATRYILMYADNGDIKNIYLYKYEIKMLII